MKSTFFTTVALVVASASAQLISNPNNTFSCPPGATAFCAGDSLSSNIIIRCDGTVGQPGNCNDNLAGISPVGVKSSALCYQTSANAGNAACSFNGIVYPDSGSPFPIAGASNGTTNGTSTVTEDDCGCKTMVMTTTSGSSTVTYTTVTTTRTSSFGSVIAPTTTAAPAIASSTAKTTGPAISTAGAVVNALPGSALMAALGFFAMF